MSKLTSMQHLKNIPRELDMENIQKAICDYLEVLKETKFPFKGDNIYNLMRTLKREPLTSGPYIGVSAFEASNRIMTDLTILYGVQSLLQDSRFTQFEKYTVEYGNENKNSHDIEASTHTMKLFGEAFNVAPSFFQTKKNNSLKKLRKKENENVVLLILYNSDARVSTREMKKANKNEYHIPVDIELY